MLCTNGHNNPNDSRFCGTCGVDTFTPGTENVQPTAAVTPSTYSAAPVNNAPTNGFSIASLVCGCFFFIYGIPAILALIFGYIARRQIKERGEKGDGMAIAGIVLGWVGVAYIVVIIIVFVVAASTVCTGYNC